ncbi:MAG TPA: hypothetical protein H9766_09130 [Candidatus Dorea faecigallinarum]|nr:hypothetical protein [Candidatus Dorea faecigallinarum]
MFTKISLKDIETYSDQGKGEALLKMQWDLQQCINERDVIKLLLPDKEKKVVLPLALWIADGELYLIGYGMTKKLEAVPVREIESFRMEQKKFSREIAEQFKNTDWKKMIQEQKERKKQYHVNNFNAMTNIKRLSISRSYLNKRGGESVYCTKCGKQLEDKRRGIFRNGDFAFTRPVFSRSPGGQALKIRNNML